MSPLSDTAVRPLIRLALREDRASADATSRAVVPVNLRIRARIIAKAPGILAGGPIALWTFQTIDPSLRCRLIQAEGARLVHGTTILTVEGRARSIMAAERTALNFLMHLSGIATLTRAFIDRTRGTHAKIFDTRKTLPGLRALEKYAVHLGGGYNHRANLADAILIKKNHIQCWWKIWGPDSPQKDTGHGVLWALTSARSYPDTLIGVEVTKKHELRAILNLSAKRMPHLILLDNWRLADIRRAVALRGGARRPLLEVSGGVTLKNVRAIAKTGVDRISIGCLTHSAPALDCSLIINP